MMRVLVIAAALLGAPQLALACAETLDHRFKRLAGDETVHLCEAFRDKVVLVVNTASKCAYTPQYEGLEDLYRQYRERGLVVAGFPSNDFGGQEPGTEAQIQEFCRLTYSVEFPMFEKTRAAKGNADPFYRRLGELAGEYPRWNFHKYLLDRDGNLVASFPSQVSPDARELVKAIESLL